jgi:hypothetical protein
MPIKRKTPFGNHPFGSSRAVVANIGLNSVRRLELGGIALEVEPVKLQAQFRFALHLDL